MDRSRTPTDTPPVPGYAVEGRLGGGGFAEIWQARDAAGRVVALKVSQAAGEAARRRFDAEAEVLGEVGPPFAPALIGRGVLDDGRPYLAMERIDGRTLAPELDAARAIEVAGALLVALEAVHRRGRVHGDLKPANIMVTGAGVTLIDFGAAVAEDEGSVAGTAAYMAPEQLVGGPIDARADLYSFGVVLYELVAGRRPFEGDRATVERGHLALRPPPLEAPGNLGRLCMACLAKDPGDRPASAAAAREMLRASKSGSAARRATGERTRVMTAQEPVIVLVVDEAGVDAASSAILERHGTLISAGASRVVAAFLGRSGPDPAGLAIAVARRLVAGGGRAALHLASLKIRERPGRAAAFYGREARDPDSWLPPAWEGLWISPVAAAVLGERPSESELFGREPLLQVIETSLQACRAPTLVTAIGEPGAGKTALAAAMEATARSLGAEVIRAIDDAGSVREIGDRLRRRAAERRVAVIIDDIDDAGDAVLDAIEYATLDGDARLWICVLGRSRLERRRPGWGDRAHRHRRLAIEPLEERAAMALAARLLEPAEYPPAATLRHLARWSGGNPAVLAALVATLKREGIVRQRSTGSWYVATAELEQLPASAAEQWMAIRALEALPPELAACARVCSVLGDDFSLEELRALQEAADASGAASTDIDAAVGVRELAARQILTAEADRWRFRRPALRDAIYKLLSATDRQALHGHAHDWWRARVRPAGRRKVPCTFRDPGVSGGPDGRKVPGTFRGRFRAAVAWHAAGAGRAAEAAAASIELGDRARAAHRSIEADRCYSDALANRGALGDRELARALGGRGSVRYRMQRAAEAIADLEAARAHAERAGDTRQVIELLLEEATARDWAEDFATSAARVERAVALIAEIEDPALEARCRLGLGRTFWRRQEPARAAALLSLAAAGAAEHGAIEDQIIALSLLGCALVVLDRLDDAEIRFDEAIALSEATGDSLHRCAAYANRAFLWSARHAPDRLEADLREAVQIAREIGQPTLERGAVHNLAEHLHWSGAHREALPLARRGVELQQRFLDRAVPEDRLLLARVAAACGDHAAALEAIRATREASELGPAHRLVVEMVEAAQSGAPLPAWERLAQRAARLLPPEEQVEVLYFWLLACKREGRDQEARWVWGQAQGRMADTPIWRSALSRVLEDLRRSRSSP